MNTANLQLEGLLVAMSTVLRVATQGGLVQSGQVSSLLDAAEKQILADSGRTESLTPAQVDAICFPIRYLRAAAAQPDQSLRFTDIAAEVHRTKPPHS